MSNSKIFLATTGTYPDGMARTYRIHCYAKSVLEAGGEILVVSTKAQKKLAGKSFFFEGLKEGVPFKILWNKGKIKNNILSYFWAQLNSYVLVFYLIFNYRKFDTVWLYGMRILPRLILTFILKILDRKVVLELNEYPYSMEGNMLTRKIPWLNKLMAMLTWKLVIPRFNGITSISQNLSKKVYSINDRIPVIEVPILIDSKNNSYKSLNSNFKKEKYIFHAGSLNPTKDGIIKVFEAYCIAAKKLRESDIDLKFYLTNKKTQKDIWKPIEQVLESNGLMDNLKITGYLSYDDLFNYLGGAECLVINKPKNLQNKYNFPTKLGDYLLSKTPVIIGAENIEVNKFIFHNENGIVTSPDDSQAMAEAIVKLCLNRELAKQIGQRGFDTAIKHFSYSKYGETLISFFSNL